MTLLALLVAFLLVGIVSYGGYLFWSRVFELKQKGGTPKINNGLSALALTAFLMATAGNSFAQSTPTITFDLSPFFDSLNAYLPIFIGLFGIVGGIAGAMALARYVIGAVVRAFSGGTI